MRLLVAARAFGLRAIDGPYGDFTDPEGYLAAAMVNYLMTLGWAPKGDTEIVPWSEIESQFRLEDVTHSPAFFDLKKLAAFNGEYIRALATDEFVAMCEPWLARWRDEHPAATWDRTVFEVMAPLVQTRIVTLAEAPAMVDFLFLAEPELDETSVMKAFGAASAGAILTDSLAAFDACDWTTDALKETFEKVAEQHGQKLGKAQAPVRVAVTGRTVGPPLFESLEQLGRERTLDRLRAALTLVPTGGTS